MEEYLLLNCKRSLVEILKDENDEKHFPVNISLIELFESDTSFGSELLKEPEKYLEELNNFVLHAQDIILQQSDDNSDWHFKENVHARVYVYKELFPNVFPTIDDTDLFLDITGTVIKTKDPKMLEYRRPYRCTKCKHVEMVEANYNERYVLTPPTRCPSRDGCTGTKFISIGVLNSENCKDYQEIKIQKEASNTNSTMPSSLWVTLEDDLVDTCKPGDNVTICGIVKQRLGSTVLGKKINAEPTLKANHIQVHNGHTVSPLIDSETRRHFTSFWEKFTNSPVEGRDIILKSFCPKLNGMYLVKLAVAVVLASGSISESGREVAKRSESHILLVGDPGTGKSQLLRYASKIIARSVLTTGVGTTSAGLTVAAIMENGQWQLEAGALVLADGGICCIDEFNSMKANDRASIHEAMEQQSISVAKAGIHCKLKTRCSILAATNPKGGHLNPQQSLSSNLALPSPLLSRFDIVIMLKDTYQYELDDIIATHISNTEVGGASNVLDGSLWTLEMLQQYFIVVKTINPTLTVTSDKILARYYQAQRRASSRNKSRTTVRLLESLIRLSQGHARLMFHTEVHVMDVIFAIVLIECSMHGECAVLGLGPLNVLESFVDDSMNNYVRLATSILSALNLHEILEYEINFLKTNYNISQSAQTHGEFLNQTMFKTEPENTDKTPQSPHSSKQISNDCDVNLLRTNIKNIAADQNQIDCSNLQTSSTSNVNKGKKRKKSDNSEKGAPKTLGITNALHLIPSVNDDFDVNFNFDEIFQNNDFVESQNTKTNNIDFQKFKCKPACASSTVTSKSRFEDDSGIGSNTRNEDFTVESVNITEQAENRKDLSKTDNISQRLCENNQGVNKNFNEKLRSINDYFNFDYTTDFGTNSDNAFVPRDRPSPSQCNATKNTEESKSKIDPWFDSSSIFYTGEEETFEIDFK